MHIGNSDPEVGPPFVVGASGGLCCIEGIRQKAGMRKLKACWGAGGRFFAAQKHRNRLCAVSGGTVTRSGPWAGCIKLPGSGGAPHSYVRSHRMNFSALKGWESGRTPGGPSPAACCGPFPLRNVKKAPGPNGPGASASILLVVHRGHIANQLHHLVGIAALIVVPGDDLHEGVGQSDAGIRIEDRGAGIAQEVGGHNGSSV